MFWDLHGDPLSLETTIVALRLEACTLDHEDLMLDNLAAVNPQPSVIVPIFRFSKTQP